jgi:isoquinoline 1-oxidoreductase alpha subunit
VATTLTINAVERQVEADPARPLLSVLRDDLELTGAKYGCGEGQCGACTVLIDGRPTRSCITELGECGGKRITTIEGLASGDTLQRLQASFVACDAMQCGYCTPGMILSAVGLLEKTPQPTRDEIVRGMNGNICRCGTYARIVHAVEQAATGVKGGQP